MCNKTQMRQKVVCIVKLANIRHCGQRGSASTVLTATDFVNGRGQGLTHRIHTLWPITKNLSIVIMTANPTAVPNLVQIRPRGGFWAHGWNVTKICLFIYLFIPFLSAHLQVRPVDGFSRLMAQTTRTRARMCLLGVSLILLPSFGWNTPETPILGRESAFSSQPSKILKVSCYRNYCIDINQIWRNHRDYQLVIVGGPSRRPTNPKWRTAAILKSR